MIIWKPKTVKTTVAAVRVKISDWYHTCSSENQLTSFLLAWYLNKAIYCYAHGSHTKTMAPLSNSRSLLAVGIARVVHKVVISQITNSLGDVDMVTGAVFHFSLVDGISWSANDFFCTIAHFFFLIILNRKQG